MDKKAVLFSVLLVCVLLISTVFGSGFSFSGDGNTSGKRPEEDISRERVEDELSSQTSKEEITASSYPFSSDYPSVSQLYNWYDNLTADHPDICEKIKYGESWEGRDLYVLKVSDNVSVDEEEPEVLVDGNIHAREWSAHNVASYFLWRSLEEYDSNDTIHWLVNNREIFVAPMTNPDGYIYDGNGDYGGDGEGDMWRKNRNDSTPTSSVGVDLNRNWDFYWNGTGASSDPTQSTYCGESAFSENETWEYKEWILSRDIESYQNIHSYAGTLLLPGDRNGSVTAHNEWYRAVASDMTGFTSIMGDSSQHYSFGTAKEEIDYTASGGANDWVYEATGAHGLCYELETGGSDFYPPESDIMTINQDVADSLFYQSRIADTDLGDGTEHLFPPDPYIVYGTVSNGGTPLGGAKVILQNKDTGETLDIKTDPNGYYEFDLGALVEDGYDASDAFKVAVGGTIQNFTIGDGWGQRIDLSYSTPQKFELQLDKGWNFVSSKYIPEGDSLASILNDPSDGVEGEYEKVFSHKTQYEKVDRTTWMDDFESDKGWTFSGGEWEWGTPQGLAGDDSYGNPDPASAVSGTGALGYDLSSNGDYASGMSSTYWATSPTIDLSGYENVTLEFQRWLGVELNGNDHAYIEVYDGSSWQQVWQNPSYTMHGGAWNPVQYDVSQYADDNPNFQIRFGLGPTNSGGWLEDAKQFCGWNIDDLKLTYEDYTSEDIGWVSYMPDRPDRFNDVGSLKRHNGFWIKMINASTLSIPGFAPERTKLVLDPGWNMVGYPGTDSSNNGLPAAVDKVGIFNGSERYDIRYDHDPSTVNFQVGEGYWIHNPTNESLVWIINN